MKKSVKKVKAVKRSGSKSSAPETQMPDLVAVMLKLTERLEAVEKKMDLVVSQTANRHSERQNHFQNQPRPQFSQQNHSQNFDRQPQRQHSEPNFNRAPQSQHPHPQNQNRGQGGKPMYQAVCAECKSSCEVPFRPTGDRPTYCKECYSKRKNGGNSQKHHVSSGFPAMEKRQLKVVSNGVGKTVISEMVPVTARSAAPSKKNSKLAKSAKKSKK